MKTSTKIWITIAAILLIPNIFLSKYLFDAIVPTGNGFEFNFSTLAWLSLAFQVLFNVAFGVVFFRFLKAQRLSNAIFFSVLPLTVSYGAFMFYISSVKNMTDVTAQAVRATLNIQTAETSYNNLLWAGIATIVYLVLLFVIVIFACRPLSRVDKITETLGDGRMKKDDVKIGGGKQFKSIEQSLNKINYNIKEKENKLKQTHLVVQKHLPKQFFKFLGKNGVEELELGRQVKKMATVMFCDLKSVSASKTLSLEENFNYINSYLKVVAPLIARYDGFVDKHFGDGMLAVFARPQSAIECANAVLRAIEIKNKNQKDLPAIDARISINTGEVVFGIGTEEENKMPTIVSNVVSLVSKMDEINLYIGTKLLISKQTINNIPENFHFNYRYTGELSLDDDKTLSLFESLENYPKNRREKLKKYKNKFEEGVHFYNEKDYQKAKESFAYVLRFVPDDKPTYVYFNKSVEKLKEAA